MDQLHVERMAAGQRRSADDPQRQSPLQPPACRVAERPGWRHVHGDVSPAAVRGGPRLILGVQFCDDRLQLGRAPDIHQPVHVDKLPELEQPRQHVDELPVAAVGFQPGLPAAGENGGLPRPAVSGPGQHRGAPAAGRRAFEPGPCARRADDGRPRGYLRGCAADGAGRQCAAPRLVPLRHQRRVHGAGHAAREQHAAPHHVSHPLRLDRAGRVLCILRRRRAGALAPVHSGGRPAGAPALHHHQRLPDHEPPRADAVQPPHPAADQRVPVQRAATR